MDFDILCEQKPSLDMYRCNNTMTHYGFIECDHAWACIRMLECMTNKPWGYKLTRKRVTALVCDDVVLRKSEHAWIHECADVDALHKHCIRALRHHNIPFTPLYAIDPFHLAVTESQSVRVGVPYDPYHDPRPIQQWMRDDAAAARIHTWSRHDLA